MTDGIQRVFGMEYRPIKALEVCASSGLKVSLPYFLFLIEIEIHGSLQKTHHSIHLE